MDFLKRLFKRHRHEWRDWCVFDSSYTLTIPSGKKRITGQAVLQICECGQTNRRPLATWRDARIARKLLPYR